MNVPTRLSEETTLALRCPRCRGNLGPSTQGFACLQPGCSLEFPIVDGRPVLINEETSAFRLSEFTSSRATTYHKQGNLEQFFSAVIPKLDKNFIASRSYARFAALFPFGRPRSRILVVGCGDMGKGMSPIVDHPNLEVVNTDVYVGRSTDVICDGHDLPFADHSFDGAIIQAVLEHVAVLTLCRGDLPCSQARRDCVRRDSLHAAGAWGACTTSLDSRTSVTGGVWCFRPDREWRRRRRGYRAGMVVSVFSSELCSKPSGPINREGCRAPDGVLAQILRLLPSEHSRCARCRLWMLLPRSKVGSRLVRSGNRATVPGRRSDSCGPLEARSPRVRNRP